MAKALAPKKGLAPKKAAAKKAAKKAAPKKACRYVNRFFRGEERAYP